jgi:hypothetical protein
MKHLCNDEVVVISRLWDEDLIDDYLLGLISFIIVIEECFFFFFFFFLPNYVLL